MNEIHLLWARSLFPALLACSISAPAMAAFDLSTLVPTSLGQCDEVVRAHPTEHEAYDCYWRLAHTRGGGLAPVLRHLERRLKRYPENNLARLWLGFIACAAGQLERAEQVLRLAAENFHARGEHMGEVLARAGLLNLLCDTSRTVEAYSQLAMQASAAERSGDRELQANAHLNAGYCARMRNDYGRAAVLYEQAREELWATKPSFRNATLKAFALDGLTIAYSESGRYRKALKLGQEAVELLRGPYTLATVRHRLAANSVRLADEAELSWEEADRRIRESLEMDRLLNGPHWPQFETRMLRALRLGPTQEAIEELERALAFGRVHNQHTASTALRLLAHFGIERDPANPGVPLLQATESIALSRREGSRPDVAATLLVRSNVHWRGGARGEAIRDGLAALDELDRLRDQQADEMVQARTSSMSSHAYRVLAGWLLDPARGPSTAEDVGLAFSAIERDRARVLLEALVWSGGHKSAVAGELRDRREAIHAALVRTQTRLLDPDLPSVERERALADLSRLERSEEAMRDELARQKPRAAALRPTVPTLAAVQQALGPDEAFLSFQVWKRQQVEEAPYQDGSSWLVTITRDSVRPTRIPDADEIKERIRFFLGVLERRDGSEAEGAAGLYRDLLGASLGHLPPRVTRLIVVPDGPLHLLPFAALRERRTAPPLATRYLVSTPPSAALWLLWRAAASTPSQPPAETPAIGKSGEREPHMALAALQPLALVLADPVLSNAGHGPSGSGLALERQSAAWIRGVQLAALPFARIEAKASMQPSKKRAASS